MKIAVVYNEPDKGSLDSMDILDELSTVTGGLDGLGLDYEVFPVAAVPGFCAGLLSGLEKFSPGLVFNLVEGVGGNYRLHPAMAALFEMAGYPHTGSPYDVLLATTDKTMAKGIMKAHGIKTPDWEIYKGGPFRPQVNTPCIVKPSFEDASVGIDDSSLIIDADDLLEKAGSIYRKFHRRPVLIESFIPGREFNVSLLEKPDGVEVFPLAEILFTNWPDKKPKIVNYNAKWVEDSFEYQNTPRTFAPAPAPFGEIRETALRCWDIFNLRGYARVDMRLDAEGTPYVIEVNANPCIAPWSGYLAAAKEAGCGPRDVMKRIIESALL